MQDVNFEGRKNKTILVLYCCVEQTIIGENKMTNKLDLLVRLDWQSLNPAERSAQFSAFVGQLNSNFVRQLHCRPEPNEPLQSFLRRTPDFCLLIDLLTNRDEAIDQQAFNIFSNFCRRSEIFTVDEDSKHMKIHICFYQEAFYDPRFTNFVQMLSFYSKMSETSHKGDNVETITPMISAREILCLQWTAEGKSLLETGQILCIEEEEVKDDLVSLVSKLDANNKVHAVAKAARMNLI